MSDSVRSNILVHSSQHHFPRSCFHRNPGHTVNKSLLVTMTNHASVSSVSAKVGADNLNYIYSCNSITKYIILLFMQDQKKNAITCLKLATLLAQNPHYLPWLRGWTWGELSLSWLCRLTEGFWFYFKWPVSQKKQNETQQGHQGMWPAQVTWLLSGKAGLWQRLLDTNSNSLSLPPVSGCLRLPSREYSWF